MADQPTMREACQPVSGYGGGDLRFTGLSSVKDCRLSPKRPPNIRSKTPVALTAGFVAESDAVTIKPKGVGSKSSQRHARRRMKRGTQRRIG